MRGGIFHNHITGMVKVTLEEFFGSVHTEYRYRRNGSVSDFDLFAQQGPFVMAFEVETTSRHALDNILRAAAVQVPLWVIVPSHDLQTRIAGQVRALNLRPAGEPIKILLPGQLQQALMDYLSLFSMANKPANKQ